MPTFVEILGDKGKYPDTTEWTLPDGTKTTVGAERAKMGDMFIPKEDFTRGQQKAAAERAQLETEYNQKLYEQQRRELALQQQLTSRTGNPNAGGDDLEAYLHDATFGPLARRLKQTQEANERLHQELRNQQEAIKNHEQVFWLNQHAQVLRRLQDSDPEMKDTTKVQDFLAYAKNNQMPNLDMAYSLYTRDRDITRARDAASKEAYERAKTELGAPRVPTGANQNGTTVSTNAQAPTSFDDAEQLAKNDPEIARIMDGGSV